jgi:hypothetical protein
MKYITRILLAVAVILIVALVAHATQPTITLTKKPYGGNEVWSFSFTHAASTDTMYIPATTAATPYFLTDAMNRSSFTIYWKSSETTTDSVSANLVYQVKGTPSDAWITQVTYSDSDAVAFSHVVAVATYGSWPLSRFYIDPIGNNAKATISGYVVFKKD